MGLNLSFFDFMVVFSYDVYLFEVGNLEIFRWGGEGWLGWVGGKLSVCICYFKDGFVDIGD